MSDHLLDDEREMLARAEAAPYTAIFARKTRKPERIVGAYCFDDDAEKRIGNFLAYARTDLPTVLARLAAERRELARLRAVETAARELVDVWLFDAPEWYALRDALNGDAKGPRVGDRVTAESVGALPEQAIVAWTERDEDEPEPYTYTAVKTGRPARWFVTRNGASYGSEGDAGLVERGAVVAFLPSTDLDGGSRG